LTYSRLPATSASAPPGARAEPGTTGARVDVRLIHVLPIVLQSIIYAYWALYDADARAHVPNLLGQVAFGLVLDAALFRWTTGRLRVSLAAVPLALSVNLFLWFIGPRWALGWLVVAAGLLTKYFVRRDGAHVMNPSAAGLSVLGVLWLIVPRAFRFFEASGPIGVPPNMVELVFLLSLVPVLRFRLSPVPIGAALAMFLFGGLHMAPSPDALWHFPDGGVAPAPFVFWVPWLLTITLFATDPATAPRTTAGRFLYGFFVGLTMDVMSLTLHLLVGRDFFSKVFPVVAGNWLAPAFDRLGTRLAARLGPRLEPLLLPACLVGWILWVPIGYTSDLKEMMFHRNAAHLRDAPGLVLSEEDRLEPIPAFRDVYLRPFSFLAEIRAWRSVRGDAESHGGEVSGSRRREETRPLRPVATARLSAAAVSRSSPRRGGPHRPWLRAAGPRDPRVRRAPTTPRAPARRGCASTSVARRGAARRCHTIPV